MINKMCEGCSKINECYFCKNFETNYKPLCYEPIKSSDIEVDRSSIDDAKTIMQLELARQQVKDRLAKGNETQRYLAMFKDKFSKCKTQKEVFITTISWTNHIPVEYDYLLNDYIPKQFKFEIPDMRIEGDK